MESISSGGPENKFILGALICSHRLCIRVQCLTNSHFLLANLSSQRFSSFLNCDYAIRSLCLLSTGIKLESILFLIHYLYSESSLDGPRDIYPIYKVQHRGRYVLILALFVGDIHW